MGDARSGELGVLKRPDGGQSSELSITITDPRVNGGRPTNIPLLVRGQVGVERLLAGEPMTRDQAEVAIRRAMERVGAGEVLPSFDTIQDAVAAAQARSRAGGSIKKFQEPDAVVPQSTAPKPTAPSLIRRDSTPAQVSPVAGAAPPTLTPLREALMGTASSPLMVAQDMRRYLPNRLSDAAPIHEQIEPDFLDFERNVGRAVPRPGEPVTPRELDSLGEGARIEQLLRRNPDILPAWNREIG